MTSGTSIPTTRFIWDSNWTLPDGPSMTMSSPSVGLRLMTAVSVLRLVAVAGWITERKCDVTFSAK
jgi:hypothetical protein